VDASVVLKWQLDDEEAVAEANALRHDFYVRGTFQAIAPQLLIYEVANGIATAARRKRIASDKAELALANLIALGVELKEVDPRSILRLALQYSLAAYDAAYLALAEAEQCELWTGDRPFYQTVKDQFSWVRWIGNYS
jgi:predicted nucleic acid-binding protein